MRRKLALIAGAVVIVGMVVGLVWRPWQSGLPDDAAFAIGDDVVTVADLDRRNDSLRALYGVQEPLDGTELATFRRQAAKSMAISLVLDQAVADQSIQVPSAEVDRALAAFVRSQFGGDEQAFLDGLGNVNTSENAVRDEIRRQLALRLLLAKVAGKVEITDAEVKAAFEDRRSTLATPQRREVSNLVLSTRGEAAAARRRLDAGTDVTALARAVSIDGATRENGGALGAVARADLVPGVAAAVFGAPAGGSYGPVRGPQGWNVGVVTRVLPYAPASLWAASDELGRSLKAEETQRRWTDWLEKKLRHADIEYAEDYRPSDPFDVTAWQGTPAIAPEGDE